VARVFELGEEMEFIAAGSCGEYVGIFKPCGKEAKILFKLFHCMTKKGRHFQRLLEPP